jgi:hypothetical protein
MSRSSGVFLILVGMAVAAYGMPSIGESGTSEPSDQAFVSGTDTAPRLLARKAEAIVPPPVVVTVVQRPDETPPSAPLVIPTDRDTLVRQLQRELRRVGCYDGDLNGAWTAQTRRAMKALIEHVNAVLPVDEPDPVHFAIAQSQADQVCGKPCPADQSRSEEGRCVPDAILSRTAKRHPSLPSAAAAVPGRGAPVTAERTVGLVTGWKTTSTAAATPLLPSSPPSRTGQAPFDGRMALAGPAGPDSAAETPEHDSRARAPAKQAGARAAARKSKARAAPPAGVAHAPRRAPLAKALFKFDWTL